jgi:hypothetical protein
MENPNDYPNFVTSDMTFYTLPSILQLALVWLLNQMKLPDDVSITSKTSSEKKRKKIWICENDEKISEKRECFTWMI